MLDAAKAFAGSDGTCGVITRPTVRLVVPPTHAALAVLSFADVFEAATAASRPRVPGVYTTGGMGSDLLEALPTRPGREHAGAALPTGGGWPYCEVRADSLQVTKAQTAELPGPIPESVVDFVVVSGAEQASALWRIREDGAGIVTLLPEGGEAWLGWEDSAVLGEYLRDLYALLHELELTGIPVAHFSEGCVHIRISFDLGDDAGLTVYRTFVERAATLVHRYRGSVSGRPKCQKFLELSP